MVNTATAPLTMESSPMTVAERVDPGHPDDEPPAGNAPIRPQGPVPPKTPTRRASASIAQARSERDRMRALGLLREAAMPVPAAELTRPPGMKPWTIAS